MVVLGHTLTPIWKSTNPSSLTSHTLSVSQHQLLTDTGSDQHRGTKTVWLVRLHLKEEHYELCIVLIGACIDKRMVFLFCCLWCQPADGDCVDIILLLPTRQQLLILHACNLYWAGELSTWERLPFADITTYPWGVTICATPKLLISFLQTSPTQITVLVNYSNRYYKALLSIKY